jgi:hypothetical protein
MARMARFSRLLSPLMAVLLEEWTIRLFFLANLLTKYYLGTADSSSSGV